MKLKLKSLKFSAGRPVAILNESTAKRLNVYVNDRILISWGKRKIIAVVDTTKEIVSKNEIIVSQEILKKIKVKENKLVSIEPSFRPESVLLINKKLNCHPLNQEELKKIIGDVVSNALSEAEIAYFVSAIYRCGMSVKEIEYHTRAMVETGKKLKLKGKIADKHSIGGIPGNRTTPLVISICSSAGLIMPKTSSRAITTAAATADVMEAVSRVEFSIPEIYKIIKKTNACLVWGGSLGLAPADSKIIKVERLLHIDPEPQLLASILSKKIAAGSKYVLIDIPYGKSAKVSKSKAIHLKKKFEKLGKDFRMVLKAIITDGSQPIGNGVGPILEIIDILKILRQDPGRPYDLEKKAVMLSGLILEMTEKAKRGNGKKLAEKILSSGKALKKFQQIISAQGGSLTNLSVGKFSKDILSNKNGRIMEIDNKKINFLARILGCPSDKKAGIYFHKHKNNKIKKQEILMTFYAESEDKLKEALKLHEKLKPIKIRN